MLRLTAFEHYMFADDGRPGLPMSFWLRLTVRGTVDAPCLTAAVAATLSEHPLLQSRISGPASARTQELEWRRAHDAVPWIDVAPAGAPFAYPGDRAGIDLTQEIGLRLFVRQGDDTAEISLQLAHAATDALGAARFLEDVLARYAGLAPARPVDPALLAGRGRFHLTPAERRGRVVKDLLRAWLFFRKIPAPLATGAASRPFQAAAYPAVAAREVGQTALKGLRATARRRGGTVNDLLLTELFLTLDAWNRAHGGRRNLRLAMPMSMRLHADAAMPAANVVSMCFLDRQGEELDDPQRLFASIMRETSYLKSNFMGYALIFVTGLIGRLRRGVAWTVTPRLLWRCAATAVLSNLGDPWRGTKLPRAAAGRITAGNLEIERLELMPPLRPGTHLALGAVTYGGRLALSLHLDQTALTPAEGRELADAYVARLEGAAEKPSAEAESPLLDRLIREHAAKRAGAEAFRGWAVGKHVRVAPVFEAALPPSAPKAPEGPSR